MTEKTEEDIEKDRAAIAAMKNAKSNMEAAIARVSDLERALSRARDSILRFKSFVPEAAYSYGGKTKLWDEIDAAVADIEKVRGKI